MIALRKPLGRIIVFIFALFACSALAFAQETQEGRLMRFPDVYKDKVVFFYGGDLWLASTSGGVARRITSSQGRELFPKFSPDGKWIAFTGQYDGNFNVYVMPADGGQPKQLTFYQGSAHQLNDRMGIHDEVINWTPDSKRIVFLTGHAQSHPTVERARHLSGARVYEKPITIGELRSIAEEEEP